MRKKLFLLFPIFAVFVVAPALAHHSFAMFATDTVRVVKGEVVKFAFVNPHSWISVKGKVTKDGVTGDGAVERWDIEAGTVYQLRQMGFTPESAPAGTKVTIAFHPLRDGRKAGSLALVVMPDGKFRGANPRDLGLNPAVLTPPR